MSLIRKMFIGKPIEKAISRSNLNIDFNRLLQNSPVVFYNFDKKDFIEKGYRKNAEVYKIIRKIVEKASIADLYLYVEKSNKYTKYKKHRFSSDVGII